MRNVTLGAALALAFLFRGQAPAVTPDEQAVWDQANDWYSQGYALNDEGAASLEKRIATDPDNEASRFKALTYYLAHYYDKGGKERCTPGIQAHYLWLSAKRPAKPYFVYWSQLADPSLGPLYRALAQGWQASASQNAGSAGAQGNAALFLAAEKPAWAEWYYLRAQKLEPLNPRWRSQLGDLLVSGAPISRSSAARALAQYDAALSLLRGTQERYELQLGIGNAAWWAGQMPRARLSAQALLDVSRYASPVPRDQMSYYEHEAKQLLGLVAYQEGRRGDAVSQLLDSGRVEPGSLLKSKGPDFTLAKFLLAAREKDAVLKYLVYCEKFWDNDRLHAWEKAVEAGGQPSFDKKAALK
jgi:hypothetical protein